LLDRDTVTDPCIMAVDERSRAICCVAHEVPQGPVTNSGYATPVVLGDQVIMHRPAKVESYAHNAIEMLAQDPNATSPFKQLVCESAEGKIKQLLGDRK
jgi:hypothetical protein